MTIHPRKQHVLEVYGREPQSLDELAECVIKVIDQQVPVLGFKWDIRKGNVGNTHDCPLDGVTNWGGREEGAPRSYPGWEGRVWIRYAKKTDGWSDVFDRTLTHPGKLGGGSYSGPWQALSTAVYKINQYRHLAKKKALPEPEIYSWDYRFFDSDWSELYNTKLLDVLAGVNMHHHTYAWEAEGIAEQDEKVFDMFKELNRLGKIKG